MRQSWIRYILIFNLLAVSYLMSCASDRSKTTAIYNAEKMFYQAGKIQKNIMINPDIASSEEYQKAEKAYRDVIVEYTTRSESIPELKVIVQRAWLAVADLHLLQKNFEKAIEIYEEIIQKSPKDRELSAQAQYSIASGLEKLERIDEAIEAYQKIVTDYPPILSDTLLPNISILQTPIYIARLYLRLGKNDSAAAQYVRTRNYYQQIQAEYPNSVVAMAAQHQIAITYGDQNDWQKVVSVMENIIHTYQDYREVFGIMFELGNIYHQQIKDSDKSIELFKTMINLFPDNEGLGHVFLALGGVYLQQQKYADARLQFQLVLDRYKSDKALEIQALVTMGRSYELEGDWQKAQNEYQWIVENHPNTMDALNIPLYIAEHYRKARQEDLAKQAFENAIQKYDQIIEHNPNTMLAVIAMDYMAKGQIRLDRWRAATETMEKLIRQRMPVKSLVEIHLALGGIYEEKVNDEHRAIATYQSLLEKFPQIPIAESLTNRITELEKKYALYQQSNQPPLRSEIIGISQLAPGICEITWQKNPENDFRSYKLYRSQNANVDSTSQLIAEIYEPMTSQFTDNTIQEGNTYYYRLYVTDKGGLVCESQKYDTQIEEKDFVAEIQIEVKNENWSTNYISWTQCNAEDFDCYKIFRSTSPGVNATSQLVRSIFDKTTTSYRDKDLSEQMTYYYRVYAYSTSGANQPGNEVAIQTTVNIPPTVAELQQPQKVNQTTIQLTWSSINDADFSMYRIYRAERSPVSLDSAPLWMTSNNTANFFQDSGLVPGRTYYYKIVVYDKGGLSSESNEVSITL